MLTKKLSLKNQSGLIIPYFLFFIMVLIVSCNSGDKANKDADKKEDGNATKTDGTTKADFLGGSGKYAVLKLSKNDLLTLFGGSGVQKLLLEFTDNNDAAAPTRTINAIAYAAKPQNDVVGSPVFLFPENISSPQLWDTTGVQILGNNEFSRKDARTALGNVKKIDATTAADLYFYPIKFSNNHIGFKVSKILINISAAAGDSSIKATAYPAGSADTKPSPPAPPCATCD